jgi:hypothetical protein
MNTAGSITALVMSIALLAASGARADESGMHQASRHFQRGVSLYGEADYRAALVEFKRAYALAPNAAVLYNVGETQYQLQDYAGALATFERFLAETVPGDSRKQEVEGDIDVLRARVGHLTVVTVPGADVTLDDQPVGKSPLDKPLLVSIGHRKVVATLAGRTPVTRFVDVATDDNATITLPLPESSEPAAAVAPPSLPSTPVDAPPPSHGGSALRVLGWTATGALAAGAITFGVLADRESNTLKAARSTFPTSAATLNHDASLASTYSILADSLAAATIVVGGVTLLSTLMSGPSSGAPTRGSAGTTRIVLGPASARLDVTF